MKHANPCGAAEAAETPEAAWEAALAGDPVSAYGGVVAVTTPITAPLAERLTSLFLEVVVAPAVDEAALPILARREHLRVLLDPAIGSPRGRDGRVPERGRRRCSRPSPTRPPTTPRPGRWRRRAARRPTSGATWSWRGASCRHVKSNAIVLAREVAGSSVSARGR